MCRKLFEITINFLLKYTIVRSCFLIITLPLFYMNSNESCSTVLKNIQKENSSPVAHYFFINVILHLYRQLQQSMQTRSEWLAKQSIYKHLGYFSIHTLSSCHSEFELDTTAAVRSKHECILQLPPLNHESQAKSAHLSSLSPTLQITISISNGKGKSKDTRSTTPSPPWMDMRAIRSTS